MISMKWFEAEEELSRLTKLDHDGLLAAGFDLDDWDFGVCCSKRLHGDPEPDDDGYLHELTVDWDREGYWLLARMQDYCCGASYVKLGRRHFYLVHHA